MRAISKGTEVAVALIEIVLLIGYAIPAWAKRVKDLPPENQAVVVHVVGEQFAWNVHYPGPDGKFGRRDPKLVHFSNPIGLDRSDPAAADDIVSGNELHLPLGKPTLITLTSKDVIHDFFVPEFRIKQDAVPGMTIPVWVEPTQAGTYDISCAQLCGFAHSLMRGDAIVESQKDFDAWLKAQSAQAQAAAPKKQAEMSW